MLTEVLQTIFYSFYNQAVHIISGVLCLVTSFISWFRVIRVHFCVSWSLHTCLNFGVGDKGSEYTIKVNIQALLKAFLNMPLRSACFTHTAFSGKKWNFLSWDCSQVLDYQDFWIIVQWIKGILLYNKNTLPNLK
jgi:hypothetical protein